MMIAGRQVIIHTGWREKDRFGETIGQIFENLHLVSTIFRQQHPQAA